MRTTIRLGDELLRLAKQRAIESGKTLNTVIEDAVRAALTRRPPAKRQDSFDLPVSGGGGTLPGVDLDDTAALTESMEGGE